MGEASEQLMRRYGPLVFSHFFRGLHDEDLALRATRVVIGLLGTLRFTSDLHVVRWVRALPASRGPLAPVPTPEGLEGRCAAPQRAQAIAGPIL